MADADFVDSLYRNVLARDPDAEGASAWVNYISAGATHDQVRAAFVDSVETQTFINPVIRLYEGLLGRAPDAAGLKTWADALRGGASLNSVTEAFLNSDEAIANGFGGLDNVAFVKKLYAGMGRTQEQVDADADGVAGWVSALDTMSRASVAQAFLECAENLQHSNDFVSGYVTLRAHGNPEPSTADINGFVADQNFVEGLYRNVLARDPDAAGANGWVSHLAGGATDNEVKAAFINSTEAQNFVNPIIRLYEGLLKRAPDVEGLKAWTDALHGGASLTDITEAFLNCDEAIANGFGGLDNMAFVKKLYAGMGRSPDQIDADAAGVAGWVSALDTMSRATVAQAFMECAENVQNSNGFVLGWGALRAAGNPGPTTAQLDNFSDTATTAQIIASADAVGMSTTTRPTGDGASPYNVVGTADELGSADQRLLNGATNITATTPVTVALAMAIEGSANTGTDTYSVSDTVANLAAADPLVFEGATGIDATGNATVTLTGAQVTDAIVAKFDASDDLTLSASGAALSAMSATTLGDVDVVAINASNATLAQLATIQAAANPAATISYGLADTGANLASASTAVLSGATAINATDDAVTLYDDGIGDGVITDAIIAKFAADDRLTLNAEHGTTFSALSAATLGDARVYVLDSFDNAATLTNDQVTDAIVKKFDPSETLTLNASGETLSALSAETLRFGNPSLVLNASDNAITLTAEQFFALDADNRHSIDAADAIVVKSDFGANALDLNGVGGGAVTVVFEALDNFPDNIDNFIAATDSLQFSKEVFAAGGFLWADNVAGTGGEGFADTRFLYDTDSGNLFYDADGNDVGAAVEVAAILGLTQADILIA